MLRNKKIQLKYLAMMFAFFSTIFSGCNNGPTCTPLVPQKTIQGDLIQTAEDIADSWIGDNGPENLKWDWEEGVLTYALTKLHYYTSDEKYLVYIKNYIDYYVDNNSYDFAYSDHVPPVATAVYLCSLTCDEKYYNVLNDAFLYLSEEAPRTPEGGISHLGTLLPSFPQLWIDSLFMFGIPLIEAGKVTGDEKYISLIFNQMIIFSDLLQDTNTGLYRHAWFDGKPIPEESVFWGRGNGWVSVSMVEFLRSFKKTISQEDYEKLYSIFLKLVNGIINFQDPSGAWHTVINYPNSYTETSATALFTYTLFSALNTGLIGDTYAENAQRGLNAIMQNVKSSNGRTVVKNISGPTSPGNVESYLSVPLKDNLPYGVGSVILALLEAQIYMEGHH